MTAVKVTLDGSPVFGSFVPLTAREMLSDGSARDCTSRATWVSSDQSVAYIRDQGIYFAVGQGQTVVSATCDNTRGDLTITVPPAAGGPNAVRIGPVGGLVNVGVIG